MKKAIIPIAAVALTLASCDTGTKDSHQTITFKEYNLIVDTQSPDQPATASEGTYEVKINYSKNLIDVKASDIIINNQKVSFETEPTKVNVSYYTADGVTVEKVYFSPENSPTSTASNLNAEYMPWKVPSTNSFIIPEFNISYVTHLNINYLLAGRYKVQSFTSPALYTGTSTVMEGSHTYSSQKTRYATNIDFVKNLAAVYIYLPEYAATMPEGYTKELCLVDVPVKFSHDSYSLEAASPKTTILGKNSSGQITMVETDEYKVTDFKLAVTSSDLTNALISYKLNGREYMFTGCAALKP